jgi:hypothetical protein
VRHHALGARVGAGLIVELLARRGHHLIGEEPVLLDVGGRRRDQGDLGIAVEEDFLDVVVVLQVLERLLLLRERLVPAGLADGLARADEIHQPRVVAQEMRVHVEDHLILQPVGALLRHRRCRSLGPAHVEQAAVDLVHGDKRSGHAGRALEESPAIHALLAAEFVGHRQQPAFDLALILVLRIGIELVAGNDLRRYRRLIGAKLGRHQRRAFVIGQLTAHDVLLGIALWSAGLGVRTA